MPAYAPHDILRRVDNALLARYAKQNGLFEDLHIDTLKPTDIEPLYNAIQKLESAQREQVERDLRNVATVADKRRIQQLFAALQYEKIAFPEFNKKRDSHDKAMWALLEHPKLFEAVLNYSFAFTEQRHWQKFPYQTDSAATDAKARERLSKAIGGYFRLYDGRGEHCQVEHHSFQDCEYLFAYPSEYPDQVPEWDDKGEFSLNSHRLAFLVIFVFKKSGNAVDIYVQEPIAVKRKLFSLWAKEIAGLDKVDTKPKHTYNLAPFHTAEHGIEIPPDSPIKALAIYKLRFAPRHNPKATYTIEADISQNTASPTPPRERATCSTPSASR